ncbi:MAG: hypothetical protein K8U57_14890 [Planctomycetes bacterium]|nr:hypothetical protein [Planctomycetota bacterium]
MFRTISILGLCVACLITVAVAALFGLRIATDESFSVVDVDLILFLVVVGLIIGGVHYGRRREFRH